MTGAAIILGELRGLIAIGIFLSAIEIKMAKEEEFMKSTFSSYEEYMKKTKKLIPFVY
jgi:protein-S-isoprenylcysteine O-methyltransferase Ste14